MQQTHRRTQTTTFSCTATKEFNTSPREMPSKSGAPQREEMLTIQVKNTTLHLNGQNLRLAAKNGCNSKTPGLHLSATHGKEAVGRLTAPPRTHQATAHLDLLHETPKPNPERETVRRPVKLAPLELPEEVKEAQKQKLKCMQQEAKASPCKPDVTASEPRTRKQSRVKSAACPSASTEPVKAQQPKRLSRPQLSHSTLMEQKRGGRRLEDVVCQGTPAPLCIKPVPVSVFPQIKAQVGKGRAATGLNPSSSPLEEGGGRRRRLGRAPCLQEDQGNSNPSTGGLSADEGRLAQGVHGRGQRAERAPRGHTQAGKGIKEPPTASWESRCGGKSHQDDCGQQSARGTLNRQAAEGGSSEHALEGVKPHASNWRLKRKKPLIMNHNNAVALERLQL